MLRTPGRWWQEKSTPQKVETYTRWSFHSFPLIEILAFGLPAFGSVSASWDLALFLLVCGHAVLCGVSQARSLDWTRGTRPLSRRMSWTVGAATAAVALAAVFFATRETSSEDDVMGAAMVFVGVLSFGTGALALGIRKIRRLVSIVLGFAVGAGSVAFPLGIPDTALFLFGLSVVMGGLLTVTSVFSVWLLNAVYELDEARETRTRLAVAEERIRFGRDLHDVLGRNLAVIALKSELAVQLAQREQHEAVEQMIEVQRIARESQREVREVVRGYREADLTSELAGAQGVLTAAGITCEIAGSTEGLPSQVQSALAWVVREATTNVLRHGDAALCVVCLKVTEGHVVLTVENDGLPAEGSPAKGSGLTGLRERLSAVGGSLDAGRTGDGLFRVVASVPLPSAAPLPSPTPRSVNGFVA